jgi:hypothetical protein
MMKGIKALTEDCIRYLAYRPGGPLRLSITQLEELEESRSTKPFKHLENWSWVFCDTQGKEVEIIPLKINNG